jgi:hypothetical protein
MNGWIFGAVACCGTVNMICFLITICYWLQVVFARPGVAGVAQRQQSRIHGEAGKYRQGQADS